MQGTFLLFTDQIIKICVNYFWPILYNHISNKTQIWNKASFTIAAWTFTNKDDFHIDQTNLLFCHEYFFWNCTLFCWRLNDISERRHENETLTVMSPILKASVFHIYVATSGRAGHPTAHQPAAAWPSHGTSQCGGQKVPVQDVSPGSSVLLQVLICSL